MRVAGMMNRFADGSFRAGKPRDVFEAPRWAGLGRSVGTILGRLAPGTRADIVLVDLRGMHYGAVRDPIKSLVECGSGSDVDTVIVDGRTLVEGRRALALDEAALLRAVQGFGRPPLGRNRRSGTGAGSPAEEVLADELPGARGRPGMRAIDVHAHYVPSGLWRAAEAGRDWYGFRHEEGPGLGTFIGNGKRSHFTSPKVRLTPEERIADMDAQSVDVQVLSIHTPFFGYHLPADSGLRLAREVNDEIAELIRARPSRFAGLATLPMQTFRAVAELERAVTVLGLRGAELDTLVEGDNWDEPRFLPLFKAAEELGALLFFHPQTAEQLHDRAHDPLRLSNSLGVITEDAIVVAILIFGGVLDACPNLRACVAHGADLPATRWGDSIGTAARGRGSAGHPEPAEQLSATALSTTRSSGTRRRYGSCSTRLERIGWCLGVTGRS